MLVLNSRPKYVSVLFYGLEGCPLLKSDLTSLYFVIIRFLMKLYTTCNNNNMDIIQNSQQYFTVELPVNLWAKPV